MLHKKKLLALALASAAAVPAMSHAQSSNVTLYGRFYPEMVVGRGTGGTAPGTPLATMSNAAGSPGNSATQYIVQANNSRLGVKGKEKITGSLTAIFQLENRIDVDTGGSTLASRDTFVGLESEVWGTVKLGVFDTVYKELGDNISLVGVGSGNFVSNSTVLSKIPLGTSSSASFHLRRGNSVQYETPDFRGFSALVQYSPDEAKTDQRNADLVSTGVKYENGPLTASLAFEQHRDLFGGSRNSRSALSNASDLNARSKDRAVRGMLQYTMGRTTFEVDVAHLEWKETGGATGKFQKYDHYSYLVGVDHRMGPWRFGASYIYGAKGDCSLVGGANCSTDGLDGSQINLGAAYSLSKRTYLFLIAARLNNGKSARYDNSDWLGSGLQPGMDITQGALGISHSF
ncbi:MAG: porin [Casimicrobiaceae bacterium]